MKAHGWRISPNMSRLSCNVWRAMRLHFGRTRSTGEPAQYNMVYAYIHRDVGLAAGELAIKLLMQLLPADVQKEGRI